MCNYYRDDNFLMFHHPLYKISNLIIKYQQQQKFTKKFAIFYSQYDVSKKEVS